MNKLKLVILTSTLLSSAAFAAGSSCEGFRLKLQNNLVDDIVITEIKLDNGATFQPSKFEKVAGHTSQIFTVNQAPAQGLMKGEFHMHTATIPSKRIKIAFTLESKGLTCQHNNTIIESKYNVEPHRGIGEVEYTIDN